MNRCPRISSLSLFSKREWLLTVKRCSDVAVTKNKLVVNNKVQYLYDVCKAVVNNETNVESVKCDTNFHRICDDLVNEFKRGETYSFKANMSMLRSLLFMGLDPESKVVQYLENELLWNAKKLNAENLVHCLSFHFCHHKTDLQKKVIKELVLHINSKADEIVNNKELLLECWKFFASDAANLDFELQRKIEIATFSLLANTEAQPIDEKILLNMVIALSQTKRRSLSLLRVISTMFSADKAVELNDPVLIVSCISSLNSLNFPEIGFLEKLSLSLTDEDVLEKLKPTAISALLKSMGQLNWKCSRLLDLILRRIKDTTSSLRPQELVSFVLAAAKLNYKPSNFKDVLHDFIFPKVSVALINNNKVWLDFVWSLAILNQLTVDHIKSVFCSSFYESVVEVDPIEKSFAKMKLLNIRAVANLEMNTIFETSPDIDNFDVPLRSQDFNVLNKFIIGDLSNFVPHGKFMVTDVKTTFGTVINAQFVVNKDLTPLNIQNIKEVDDSSIPMGYKRVNVLVVGFKEKILDSSEYVGVVNLAIRLLKGLGDVVVVIDETKYIRKASVIERVKRLRDLIKKNVDETITNVKK